MAPLLPLATTLLTFLLALSPPTATATDSTLVLDREGNPLLAGTPYYVRTALWGAGGAGGLVMTAKPNTTICPQYVAQLGSEWDRGSPVMFFPSDPSQKHVHLSSDLNIVSSVPSWCFNGIWKLTADANTGKMYVSSGGRIGGASDSDTVANWFKLERAGIPFAYKIMYCPSTTTSGGVSAKSEVVCAAVDGIEPVPKLGLAWLGLGSSHEPSVFMQIVFQKA